MQGLRAQLLSYFNEYKFTNDPEAPDSKLLPKCVTCRNFGKFDGVLINDPWGFCFRWDEPRNSFDSCSEYHEKTKEDYEEERREKLIEIEKIK